MWIAYGAIALLLLAYLGFLIDDPAHEYSTWLDGWALDAVEILASALCIGRALSRRHARAVPLVLGASLLAWALGDVVLTIESLGGATPATPSPADAFYLAFFPLAYVAVVLFMRGEVRRINSPSWLDSAVAGLGAASVCAAFAFGSVVSATGGSVLSVATNLAYPVGDLLLLVLVVGSTAMLSGRSKTPWILLASGMAMNVAGDTFNLLGSASGAAHVGAVVNGIAWPASILVMSMAVWVPSGHSDPLALPKPTGFLLPGLAAAAGLVVLVVGALGHVNDVAVGLAAATLAVVGVRLAVSVRSLRTLTHRHERHSVTDYLTGLGNRRYLFHVLSSFFAEVDVSSGERQLAFLFIDLNRFKEINDSFGHGAGDEILQHMGERFSGALRPTDALVRLGGDEFAAVLVDADKECAEAIAERLTASLQEPFALDSMTTNIDASIGIALAPEHASDAQALVSCADLAMYRAKSAGQPFVMYEQDFEDSGNLLRLAEELRVALEQGELRLHYQPQLDLRTGETLASEVLIRWPHPKLGLIPPLKFLPLAEQAGLMGALTRWVLEQALEQCAAWRAEGTPTAVSVSVNISPSNLLEPGFIALVKEQLARNSLPAQALVLEITETSIITDFERAKVVIDELSKLGVVVSVDDFGTGFTSLAYLSSLAVRELKLDRTFTTHVAQRDLQLVRSTIELGHALGLRVVAEGVEDAETLALLTELGCDIGQGYFIGMPEPPFEPAPDPMPAAPVSPPAQLPPEIARESVSTGVAPVVKRD